MSEIDDNMRRVYATAQQNDGRFLLLTADRKSDNYHACMRLVYGGYAKEISQSSDMRPGIELTGRPLPEPKP